MAETVISPPMPIVVVRSVSRSRTLAFVGVSETSLVSEIFIGSEANTLVMYAQVCHLVKSCNAFPPLWPTRSRRGKRISIVL